MVGSEGMVVLFEVNRSRFTVYIWAQYAECIEQGCRKLDSDIRSRSLQAVMNSAYLAIVQF